MKTLKITLISILSGIILALCILLVIALNGKGFFRDKDSFSAEIFGNYSMVMEKELPAEDIASLNINYGMNSADVFFREGTPGVIVIREYMNFTPRENQLSTVQQKGDTLTVTGKKRKNSFFLLSSGQDSYTEILLPPEFHVSLNVKTISGEIYSEISFEKCDKVSLSSTSGDILFPTVSADNIQVSSVSGCVTIAEAAGDKIRISTTSGDISLDSLSGAADLGSTSGNIRIESKTGSTEVSTVSGDVRICSINGNFRLNTTSGEIYVDEGTGSGQAGTVSGDIRIFLGELTGDIDASTTSGNVSLMLPVSGSYDLDFDSTSGECNTFFDNVLSFNKRGNQASGRYGEGDFCRLNISTTSGDLRITEY